MQLRSSDFHDGAAIPRRFTCDGDDLSPSLEWSGAPPQTRSFVLLCDDPDAPAGTWHHWAAYDIPPDSTGLAAGAAADRGGKGFKQAINDFRKPGYGGPCPPHRHGIHHYHFRLLALSVERLPLHTTSPSCREVEREARQHALAEAILVGLYQR
jgi:Raf kinase inhibitor-like YbhB/YbcL family protein